MFWPRPTTKFTTVKGVQCLSTLHRFVENYYNALHPLTWWLNGFSQLEPACKIGEGSTPKARHDRGVAKKWIGFGWWSRWEWHGMGPYVLLHRQSNVRCTYNTSNFSRWFEYGSGTNYHELVLWDLPVGIDHMPIWDMFSLHIVCFGRVGDCPTERVRPRDDLSGLLMYVGIGWWLQCLASWVDPSTPNLTRVKVYWTILEQRTRYTFLSWFNYNINIQDQISVVK